MCRTVEELTGDSELNTYEGGATRSSDVDGMRFDLIPAGPMQRVAAVFARGCKNHGEHNWKGGVPMSVVMNHLEAHLNKYKSGNTSEDDLAAVVVNGLMCMWYEDNMPEMQDIPERIPAADTDNGEPE